MQNCDGVGGLGAYSDSRGNPYIRQEVARYIAAKSNVAVPSIDTIFISNGARLVVVELHCITAL